MSKYSTVEKALDGANVVYGTGKDARRIAELEQKLVQARVDKLLTQKTLEDKIAELKAKYQEAIHDIGDWGSYAPEYFKEKHGLDECIAEHQAALEVE